MCKTLVILLLSWLIASGAHAQAVKASGFERLDPAARIVLMPLDVELYSISAGGVPEPQAQWTEAAAEHIRAAIRLRESKWGQSVSQIDAHDPRVIELNHLHGAVAGAVAQHHYLPLLRLPTKAERLDWELGSDTAWLRELTGADYALFVFVRDSYATAERKATIIVAALLGVGLGGGVQIGFASLVDLRQGQIVWFNRLVRASGDLREAQPAEESVAALLQAFPR